MKKIFLGFLICFAVSAFVFAEKSKDVEEKPESEQPASADMKALQMAYQLAEYGYENDSASSLICAAEILAQTPTRPLDSGVKKEGATGEKSDDASNYSVEQLLKKARSLAKKDKTLLAYAANVEKLATKGTRGNQLGPQYDVDCVGGNNSSVSYYVTFTAGRLAEVAVKSINGRDLDLFIYDENGNRIASDVSYSPHCYASFVPRWTGVFEVVVQNRSQYSGAYRLDTN